MEASDTQWQLVVRVLVHMVRGNGPPVVLSREPGAGYELIMGEGEKQRVLCAGLTLTEAEAMLDLIKTSVATHLMEA